MTVGDVRYIHLYHYVGGVVVQTKRVILIQVNSNDVAVPANLLAKVVKFEGSERTSRVLFVGVVTTLLSVLGPSHIRDVACNEKQELGAD